MEPQSAPGDDGVALLPIPDWMKARARVVSTQNVHWQKPAAYHSSATHPLRQSLSSATLKPPAKLTPLPIDNNQHDDAHSRHHNQHFQSHQPHVLLPFEPPSPCLVLPSIQKSISCPPLPTVPTRPATPPPLNVFAPTPSALPTFLHEPGVDNTHRTVTPQSSRSIHTPPLTRARTPPRSGDSANRCIPMRQSMESNKSTNKWRTRAIANPFAKRKPAAASNNVDRPPATPPEEEQHPHNQQSTIKPTTVVKKSTFRMQAAPTSTSATAPFRATTNQDDADDASGGQRDEDISARDSPNEAVMSATSSATHQPYGKMQHSPKPPTHPQQPLQLPRTPPPRPQQRHSPPKEQLFSSPPSPTWSSDLPPKPKTKAAPKPKGKMSSCVGALAEIQRKREERRAMQMQEKQRKEDEVKEHGDDTGHKFRRLIKVFRDGMKAPKKQTDEPRTTSSKLSVFVRKRPLSKKELSHKGYDVITCARNTQLYCHEPKFKVDMSASLVNHLFSFDGVFDDQADNGAVYNQSVGPLIPLLMNDGILTVFAYGQTGSGKTYTMKSVYRQAAADLFRHVATLSGPTTTVGVSFYDIYKNHVCDLLNDRKKIHALEDNDGVVQLLGVSEVAITSDTMLTDLVEKGEASRITSINGVHDDSSRSHAILRVTLYTDATVGHQTITGGTAKGRLSMVDLAGSERACETQTDDKSTRMEGAEINKSLLALKECIRAMDMGAKHVPFRQSKLTQILRDSFMCDTSRTVMIATISPCSEHSNHTLNTLRYADRLKEIHGRGADDC
ncbi:hypothetical protein H310_09942 [Aphanomyces invadans]|uniref:Kinesin-like protein n=1 Tax=Aphanomyces invadans TaxID=157072 RepID=A0A024TSK7_9STRA|nr:hypothetical protein H310_09942 [Aphanomyces invadans]ETV97140.1 hypothetical protein H310_09942 [Aphanomyces invadans]|eukprot:XP_008874386.1 hypothetical protein H310_09942 [Aphanomyces invadans]